MTWSDREALLHTLAIFGLRPDLSSTTRKGFIDVGASRSVELEPIQRAHVRRMLNLWTNEADPSTMPAGLAELRDALNEQNERFPHGN